jgi:hypothetical protein
VIKKYRVLFHHPLIDETAFRAGMARMGVSHGAVERMLAAAPVILKEGITLGEARQYAEAVQVAGGRVTIHENGFVETAGNANAPPVIAAFRDFTMCPRCGFKQQREGHCMKCGLVLWGYTGTRGGENDQGD